MKAIETGGGPLVGIRRADWGLWSGIWGSNFYGKQGTFENDYEVLCADETFDAENVIGVAAGSKAEMFVLALPLPTLIVEAGSDHLFIAQIESSEAGWSLADLQASDFKRPVEWKNCVRFTFEGGEIVFFDSAGAEKDFADDVLRATLDEGCYACEWAYQRWPGQAVMMFVRMMKEQ